LCTLRHSEHHFKSWTELEYGKVKFLTLKQWLKSASVFLDNLQKESVYSFTAKETQISRKIVQVCIQEICISTISIFLQDLILICLVMENELKLRNLPPYAKGNWNVRRQWFLRKELKVSTMLSSKEVATSESKLELVCLK